MTGQGGTQRHTGDSSRFAWLALLFGAWIVGGAFLALWAIASGRASDVAASPYHLPAYAGLLALVATSAGLLVRSLRRGKGWRGAFPPGYGSLGLGAVAALAYVVVDLGWREGIGVNPGTIEETLAPSRVLLAVALILVAATPLRAAVVLAAHPVPRAATLLSAGLTLGVLGWPGGFHPASSTWLEAPSGGPVTNGELWVMDSDGARQTRLMPTGGEVNLGYASWSGDGSRIAYTRFEVPAGSFGSATASAWSAAADGTDARALVAGAEWNWIPRYSPDGAWVAFTREAEGGPWMDVGPVGPGPGNPNVAGPPTVPLPNAEIWRLPTAGGDAERLTDSAGDDRAPVFSPDGSLILFDSTRDGNTEIYVMDADGSDPRRLTDDPGEDWGASWSPDGTMISFNSDRTGSMQIYVMAADGSDVRQLTDGEAHSAPTWSPDGRRLAYSERMVPGDIGQVWSISLDGSDARNLSQSRGSSDHVWTGGWGPDDRIVFTRTLNGPPEQSGLVRQDLGAAAMLISAALLAAVVVLFASTRPAFGSFTLVVTLGSLLAAVPGESWRFVAAGAAAGAALDVVAWRSPDRWRAPLLGAVAGGAFVLAVGAVVMATGRLEWSPTLLLGVAAAAGFTGWGLGALARTTAGGPSG